MKAASFRVLVLLISFGIGLSAVYVATGIDSLTERPDAVISKVEHVFTPPPVSYPFSRNGSIEVIANTVSASQWKMIEFTVINHNILPATYWSHGGQEIIPAPKHNGKDIHLYSCTSGQRPYSLAPGGSLTFTVPESVFTRNVETREGKFRAGFALSFVQGNHVYYWSDDFELAK